VLDSKPIPVRFTETMLRRIDLVAAKAGLPNRTAVIRLCLLLFLDALEKNGYRLPGVDVDSLLKHHDGRTHRYTRNGPRNGKKKGAKP
jgi:hypothetical protein